MKKGLLIGVFLVLSGAASELETTFENSNFTLSAPFAGGGETTLYNYNRFRVIEHLRENNWFATAIGDFENILGRDIINSAAYQEGGSSRSDTPFRTQTKMHNYGEGEMYAQLHRLYGGYSGEKHRAVFGLQQVSMGVGRIWNPTDLFNPKNPLALEPDEVYGVLALSYTYSLSSLSQMSAVVARRADQSFKYAGRLKGYLGVADAGLNVVNADDAGMVGYELEGELFKSGIGLRSEGGWFEEKRLKQQFFQGIIGADYAFENSLILAGEWLHSSKRFGAGVTSSALPENMVRARDYVGISMGYEFDPLWYGTITGVFNADDNSYYLGPTVRYSLADDMSLGIGAMVYEGEKGSEFGDYTQTLYLNIKITF